MSNDNPWSDGEVSVTLKQHKGFESPWIVVRGKDAASVKKQLEEITGLSGEGLTLHELVYNATASFQRISTVAHGLDAIVVQNDEPAEEPKAEAKPEPAAEPEPKQEGPDHVAELAKLDKKADLTAYYLKHKKEFDGNADLMAALKDRYKSEDVG